MKRTLFVFLTVIIALFAIMTLVKTRSSQPGSESRGNEMTATEKERIRQFWKTYREATELRLSGNHAGAAEAYRAALALNEQHEDALYYYGNVCLELGEFEEAEHAWRRLTQINPGSARAHSRLGDLYLCFEQKTLFDVDAAEAEYLRAHEINKVETGPTLRLGMVALIRGDLSQAQGYFEAVIGSNFKSVEAHFFNSYLAWKAGDVQQASALLLEAAEHARPLAPAQGVLGEGDTKTGHSHELRESSHCQIPFQGFYSDLSELDEASVTRQMDDRYQRLEMVLKQVRQRIKSK